jgi:UDP-GlcNAc:undecaprenyl-phosphate GlcNAc-1-phosphate transferase
MHLWILLLSLLLSLAFTPLARKAALRLGILDLPKERGVHSAPQPLLGGLAIYLSLSIAVLAFHPREETWGVVLAGGLAFLLGLRDDWRPLRPAWKLLGQVLVALVLYLVGVRISYITHPLGGGLLYLGSLSLPLTVFWTVALMNAINLIDGLDGLAAGVSGIAGVTLLFLAAQQGQPELAVFLSAALVGSLLGFLPYNFHPARIFMGDAGALTVGLFLAAITVEGSLKSPATLALAVPVLALGLPLFDTSLAIVRRLLSGKPVGQADRGHLHHRLLEAGLSHREAEGIL